METTLQNPTKRRAAVDHQPLVRHLDLFSGIGGFALAAKMVGGIETIGFSEIEPYACRVLAKNFPNVPNHGDIRNVRNIPAELITGGFPCQPFSSAGKRAGSSDDRWLWPEMLRVIEESRPTWVLGENVAGIINMELHQVLSDLEDLGYSARAFDIPAVAVDARHRRHRVWIVGNANGDDEPELPVDAEMEILRDVGHANGAPANAYAASSRQWRATGEPARWPPEPGMDRMADGVSTGMDTHRLRGLGNAIVPQVAAEILRAMMAADCMTNANGDGSP